MHHAPLPYYILYSHHTGFTSFWSSSKHLIIKSLHKSSFTNTSLYNLFLSFKNRIASSTTVGLTSSKITWPQSFKCLLSLTNISLLLPVDLGNTLHIFFSMETLHILPLIFTNSHFPCIITIFWTKFFEKLKSFLSVSNDCSGITLINILLQTA